MSRLAVAMMLLAICLPNSADNTKTTVAQVTENISLTENVDYHIESATPFANNAVVDIVNIDHAVVILDSVKPSAVISKKLLSHVKINGKAATNNSNCQIKLYNRGAIILPYGQNFIPLTVYSEQHFKGDSTKSFRINATQGGYMVTLNAQQLNNRIRSFKLKRGYMVTFANKANGRGYSRCFIAANKDLEVPVLPGVLDRSISSYRIFRWYDTGKACLANDTRAESVSALNVTSCYSFGLGESRLPDAECVPHHIYEDWPSASACGGVGYSPHLKTNNEPGNSADDHPQTVKQILDNWENLMATGMRLCSPSSHDGSLGHLREFMDSIDARGWRCDIIDLHCYWPEGSFNGIKGSWVDRYHRPIWISEWVWGASWNNNGAFASGVTEAQNCEVVERICEKLNSWDYIERYYYWNSERDPSRIYKDGHLTAAGKMYANLNSGVGYNGKYDYAPRVPKQREPGKLTIQYDKEAGTALLKWYEYNGELNTSVTVQRKRANESKFTELAEIVCEETAANYSYTDSLAKTGDEYKVVVIDGNNRTCETNVVVAAVHDVKVGDKIEMEDGTTKYLGGNAIVNGDFDLGFYGWNDYEGNPLAMPYFQVPAIGGVDGGSYLQAYGNATKNQALKNVFDVDPNSDYYFGAVFANGTVGQTLYNGTETKSAYNVFTNRATDAEWTPQNKVFNTQDFSNVTLLFRSLQRKAQTDKLMLCKLFNTREEAIADGVEKAKLRAEAIKGYNIRKAELNNDLTQQIAAISGNDENALTAIEDWNTKALQACKSLKAIDSLAIVGNAIAAFNMLGHETVTAAIAEAQSANTINGIIEAEANLRTAIDRYMLMTLKSTLVKNPKFASLSSWTTKCGTYTEGDQRKNTVNGITFWNAWWSGISAAEGTSQTMEIKQEINGLEEGYYALQCDAATEHYCISDQHAYIISGDITAVSPVLSADYFDLPTVKPADVWQTLTTTPVYVPQGGSITIGFKSSKQGAIDEAWQQIGGDGTTQLKAVADNREGWWGATNFRLYLCTSHYADGINTAIPEKTTAADGLYTISGRMIGNKQQLSDGLYIQVSGGQARKVIIKN